MFHGLLLRNNSLICLITFSDANLGVDQDDKSSTLAYVIYHGSTIIKWKSSKQKTIPRSSIKIEHQALARTLAEISWISNLLQKLGIAITQPPHVHCDNIGATYLSVNPVFHSRVKHLALLSFCATKSCMTKPLSKQRF